MLALEHEVLHVRRQIGMRLEPVAAGDAGEDESAPVVVVLGRELRAQLLDARDRQLDQLGEHAGLDRFGRSQDDGLDGALGLWSRSRDVDHGSHARQRGRAGTDRSAPGTPGGA